MDQYEGQLKTEGCLRMCGLSHSTWYGYLACKKKREERAEIRKNKDEKIMANMRSLLKSFHGLVPGARTFRVFLW